MWGYGQLFFRGGNVGGMTVFREDNFMLLTMMIVERNLELVRKSVDNGGTDTEASKGTWPTHESDFGNVLPVGGVFSELVVDKGEDFFGHFVTGFPFISFVVEF